MRKSRAREALIYGKPGQVARDRRNREEIHNRAVDQ